MTKFEVVPISYDSMGVRSMATFVDCGKTKIFLDACSALAPYRYGLRPSDIELEALRLSHEKIVKFIEKSDYITVTHYHYDHFPHSSLKEFFDVYKANDVKLLIKDFRIEHRSARIRGKKFVENLKGIDFEFCDGKKFELENDLFIEFSNPVWHGEINSKVGRVIMVYLKKKENSLIFSSDAQFLIDENALNFVLERNPKILIVDGFPTILAGFKVKNESFYVGLENMKKVIENVDFEKMILDHHIVRDKNYREKIRELFETAEKHNKKILTAAEFIGKENLFLEAFRDEIYKGRKFEIYE